jgi:hypothetical protein
MSPKSVHGCSVGEEDYLKRTWPKCKYEKNRVRCSNKSTGTRVCVLRTGSPYCSQYERCKKSVISTTQEEGS